MVEVNHLRRPLPSNIAEIMSVLYFINMNSEIIRFYLSIIINISIMREVKIT